MLAFGPDGMLYASLGDGGEEGDPNNRAQNKSLVFGKILRFDVRSGSPSVPSDNPYGSYVWSYGLRNPWRYSFDRVTGDMYIGDVGNEQYEEIDVAPAPGRGRGANFGWVVFEGNHCFDPPNCSLAGATPPVIEYDHTGACCVIGGYVYRGSKIPGLQGTYFYGDFCGDWVRSFYYSGGQATQKKEWPGLDKGRSITGFGQDSAGELYFCTYDGNVYRIVEPTVASQAQSPSQRPSRGRARGARSG
jgi:glucose/arabinose dehydrogenase